MWFVTRLIGAFVDLTVAPFRSMPFVGLCSASLAVGLVMVFIFKWTSNKKGIRRAKDRIMAHLLEMFLYRDDPIVSLQAQGNILKANLRYMGHALVPLIVMLPLVVLILVHLDAWYGKRPLKLGEAAFLKVELQSKGVLPDPTLQLPEGIVADTPAFRLFSGDEVDWTLRPAQPGVFDITIDLNGSQVTKRIVAGEGLAKLSALKAAPSLINTLFKSTEEPIPKDSPFRSVEISYAQTKLKIWGKEVHWMVPFFVLSVLFAFVLKGPLKVEI